MPVPAEWQAARTVEVSSRKSGRCERRLTFVRAGLGHSITNCPKLEENQRRTVMGHVGGRDEGGY